MDVTQVAPNLWRWLAPHPDWTPEADADGNGWGRDVGCLYLEAPDALVLFDPLAPADAQARQQFWRSLDRDVERLGPPHVLITVYWHARSAPEVLERYDGAHVWAHENATGEIGKRVGFTDTFAFGDPLPGGVVPLDALRAHEVMYWLPDQGALVTGDVILGDADGGLRVCPDSWLPDGLDPREFRGALRTFLDLPIERVIVSHGEPVLRDGHAALARALGVE